MMATAKTLVPGIHAMGQRLCWERKTVRPITIEEARLIADKVCHISNILNELATIEAEIVSLAA